MAEIKSAFRFGFLFFFFDWGEQFYKDNSEIVKLNKNLCDNFEPEQLGILLSYCKAPWQWLIPLAKKKAALIHDYYVFIHWRVHKAETVSSFRDSQEWCQSVGTDIFNTVKAPVLLQSCLQQAAYRQYRVPFVYLAKLCAHRENAWNHFCP